MRYHKDTEYENGAATVEDFDGLQISLQLHTSHYIE